MELESLKNKLLLTFLDGGMSEDNYKELQMIADTIPPLQLLQSRVVGRSEQLVCIDCKSYKICSNQHDTKQTCSLFNPTK